MPLSLTPNLNVGQTDLGPLQSFLLADFTGGLRCQEGAQWIAENESNDLCNVDPMPSGGFCRRNGVRPFAENELPSPICHFFGYENLDSDQVLVLASLEDGTVWASDQNAGTPRAFNQIVGCPTASVPDECCWRGVEIDFKLYLHNGPDPSCITIGFGAAELGCAFNDDIDYEDYQGGSFPQAKYVTVWNGFVWAADIWDPQLDDNGDPVLDLNGDVIKERNCNRLRFSWPLNDGQGAEDWNSEDYFDIDAGFDGDCITGIVPCGEFLYVFKNHSTYRVEMVDDSLLGRIPVPTKISDKTGAVNCDAIVCCEGLVFAFDAKQGLTAWGAETQIWSMEPISAKLCDLANNRLDEVSVGFCKRRIWVSMPVADGMGGCVTYVLDLAFGDSNVWTKYDLQVGPFYNYTPRKGQCLCIAASKECPGWILILDEKDSPRDNLGCVNRGIDAWWCTPPIGGSNQGIGNPFVEREWCDGEIMVTLEESTVFDVSFADESAVPISETTISIDQDPESDEPAPTTFRYRRNGGEIETADCTTTAEFVEGQEKLKECLPGPTKRSCLLQMCIRVDDSLARWCVCAMTLRYRESQPRKRVSA